MAPLSFQEARALIVETVRAARAPGVEETDLHGAPHRILAEDIAADRPAPAIERSMRDGFAVRAADLPGLLAVVGEARAGSEFAGELQAGDAVAIMTGAAVPPGADAVVMVEHTTNEDGRVRIAQAAEPGQNIEPRGSHAAAGEILLRAGRRLDCTAVALLAAVGRARVRVYRKPVVSILPTGDEVVEVTESPRPDQVRNSNAWALAAQVVRAGGRARMLPVARDAREDTREKIERALASDLLLLSGGVSAGRYDVVEPALADLGAQFYFDRVLIQPGQPLVFGRVAGTFFFGLPGNPASTIVTFEVLARAALELLAGQGEAPLHLPFARLTRECRHRAGLTRFLPAQLSADGGQVTPVAWHGSGDIPALARANAWLVAEPDRPEYAAGEWIRVLVK